MLLCAAALACGSFGVGIDAARAAGGGDRPLLVFVLRFADSAADAQWVGPWDQSFALDRFFGAGDASVNGYVKVASGGAFSFRPAAEAQGQVNDGIVEVNYPGSMADFRNSQRAALGAMRASDDLVDYTRFDTDGDQVLEPQELAIELVELVGDATRSPETGPLCCMESPDGIDGLAFARDLNVAAVNATSNQMTTIHELFHQAFATIDGYGWGVGQLDVMGPTMDVPDAARWLPNAVTRLEAGWLRPTIVEADAMPLLEVGDAVIVRDPSAGNSQYFVVEYRNGAGLDREASAAGIVVWRVVTSPRRVELITPAVIASDTRVSGCEGGCRRGSTTDAFAPNSNQPIGLRYINPSSRYSAGPFTGIVLTPMSGGASAQIGVQFHAPEPTAVHTPAAAAPTTTVSRPRLHVTSTPVRLQPPVVEVAVAVADGTPSSVVVEQLHLMACVLDLPACSPALREQVLRG